MDKLVDFRDHVNSLLFPGIREGLVVIFLYYGREFYRLMTSIPYYREIFYLCNDCLL
jgi:hypothetical protein